MAAKKVAKKAARKKQPRTQKSDARTRVLQLLHAKFGKYKAISLAEERAVGQVTEYLSTGVDVIDHYVLGRGGLAIGRMSEIFGPESCGKTSLGYSAVATTQRAGGQGIWIDTEQSFDDERARVFGVDPEKLILLQPEHLEELFEMLKFYLRSIKGEKIPTLLVHDSIAASVTKAANIEVAGKRRVGDVPLLMSDELKKIIPLLGTGRAHLMALNQIRAKIGVMFGDNTTTPGGNAPKFYSSQRIQFFGGKAIKNARGEHLAKIVTVIAVKNRLAPPYRKARVRLDYATGFNNIFSTCYHAKRFGKIDAREEGFRGASREGLAVYQEALEELDWSPSWEVPEEPLKLASEKDGGGDDDDDGEE